MTQELGRAGMLRGVLVLALLLLFGLVLSGPATVLAEPVELIPREVLFGNPDRFSVRLSPDGRYISFVAPWDGVLNVWVAPVDAPEGAVPVTRDRGRGVTSYVWTYLPDRLLYVQDQSGDENWRVYSVDVSSGEVVDLTPFDGVQAQLLSVSPDRPGEVVLLLNDRIPFFHDAYVVDLVTGRRTLLYENNEGFAAFYVDATYDLRYALAMTPDGGAVVVQWTADGWLPVDWIGPDDVLTTAPIGLNRAGDTLYWLDSRGRDTAALVRRDLRTGEEVVLYADSRADVNDALVDPVKWDVQAASSMYDRIRWEILDPAVADDLAYLETLAEGDWSVVSRTAADDLWIVAYDMDVSPMRYYLYDRGQRSARFLFTNNSRLEQYTLAAMHPVVIPARDGLPLVSYLTLPPWLDATDEGVWVKERVPLVLVVHGGPWARDVWGYNAEHQWLANRGYAVLSVNFRGSTGFGKAFINAGNMEWGGKMQTDLLDAVEWAIAQGIADPDRIAIFGGSYGGYAVLMALTQTPDVFAAGIDLVGPSNLVTLLESIPPYWAPQLELFTTRVGDHRTEEGRAFLTERSPLTYVDAIRKPLLIGQGANDPRVKQSESDQIVAAMKERGIPVTYLLYPDEGHGFGRAENSLSFVAVAEAFLAQHIGGRMEPIGDALANSSAIVVEGGQFVPGLQEALDSRAD